MGKSSIGPDMLDCVASCRAIELANGCTVTLQLERAGLPEGLFWHVHAIAAQAGQVEPWSGWLVAVGKRYPDGVSTTFDGFLLGLLYSLEAAISRKLVQRTFEG